jgi:cytochrome c biogenesis protein
LSSRNRKSSSLIDKFWDTLNSMRFAVILLLIMTAVSIAGVLLPQFPPEGFGGTLPALYVEKFGRVLGGLFIFLGLDHLFAVWWYYLLLALLCFNIVVCSFNRLGSILRLVRRRQFLGEERSYRELTNSRSSNLALEPGEAAGRVAGVLKSEGYRVFLSGGSNPEERLIYARRGSLNPLGPFLTHISMVLIVLGAAFSYLMSFEHFQWMAQGNVIGVPDLDYLVSPGFQLSLARNRLATVFGLEAAPSPLIGEDHAVRESDWRDLPANLSAGLKFKVRLDKFEASFTPQGKPKAYLSTVTVLGGKSGEEPLFSHVIRVNDPLIHEGVYFYQSSYAPGGGGAGWIELTVASSDSLRQAETWTVRLKPGGEAAPLGVSGDSVRIARFVGSFKLSSKGQIADSGGGEDTNPAIQAVISRGGVELMKTWAFKNFPDFSHGGGLPYSVKMGDYEKGYITGLTIRTHRSQNLIWLGFATMILGITLSFYVNHRELWALVRPAAENESRVIFAGLSHKWKQPFLAEFARIASRVAALAPVEKPAAATRNRTAERG